ncbi:hypothetical protein A5636_09855 [Mycobacterium asiaticum]|uniref:Uncharacterized protein n=1 Tax=Mycobacterium asiaticum TaxID=1790 RepID=A0A1A3MT72_MYCAS|nr:hypothetical protein A5661_05535 [Mycobacterium asiaticum]OBK13128.1 hypothetical protein A5636_09855 [Mycobacterium asiaticum]
MERFNSALRHTLVRRDQTHSTKGDLVEPRHYPRRSYSFLDDDLMNREMYNHVHEEPIRLSSRIAFRLRRS